MNDYIKREDALSEMAKAECGLEYEECNDCSCSYICRIRDIPSADVRENVRGYWKKRKDKPLQNWYQCSNCGAICGETPKYCSECGAEMRHQS